MARKYVTKTSTALLCGASQCRCKHQFILLIDQQKTTIDGSANVLVLQFISDGTNVHFNLFTIRSCSISCLRLISQNPTLQRVAIVAVDNMASTTTNTSDLFSVKGMVALVCGSHALLLISGSRAACAYWHVLHS